MLRAIVALLIVALLSSAVLAEQRIALLITNQAYSQPGAALANTHRDGEILAAALEKVGFKVWVTKDTANEGALLLAVGEHVQRLTAAGHDAVGFFYYSGHGAADRPNGENYLIPTGMPITRADQLPLMAARLDRIMATLSTAGKMSFVVFDACRNVPLQRSDKSPFKGFVPVREQNGLLVAFATEPGNVAIDNNLYAKALAEELVKPGQEAAQVFRRVRQRVRTDTDQKQRPEFLDKRDDEFQFVAAQPPTQPPAPKPAPAPEQRLSEAAEAWDRTKDTNSTFPLEAFIRRFGDTYYGDLARARLTELRQAEATKQAAEAAVKKKADEEARVRAEAERQRLALLQQQQEEERRRVEIQKKLQAPPPITGGGQGRDWVELGCKQVSLSGRARDAVDVGRRAGRFLAIRLHVRGADLEMLDLRVIYSQGQPDDIPVRSIILQGTRTRPLDLRGRERSIDRVEMVYRSVPNFKGLSTVCVEGLQ